LPGSSTSPSRSTVWVAEPSPVTQPSATDPADPVQATPTGPEDESPADDSPTGIDLRHPHSRGCSTRQARPIGRCRPSVERVAGVPCRGRGPPPGMPGLRPGPVTPLVNRFIPTRPPSLVRS
jgi:hypothetical protein